MLRGERKIMNIGDAKEMLGIKTSDQLTKTSLKKAYRAKSMIMHPDMGGSVEGFVALQAAFLLLSDNVDVNVDVDDGKDAIIAGHRKSELGKGYPLTESASTCGECDGNGYHSFIEDIPEECTCPVCGGDGLFAFPCKKCKGSGRYIRNGKDLGPCNLCNGSGKFYPENKKRPRRQWFDGWGFEYDCIRYIPGTTRRAHICKNCAGTGSVMGEAKKKRVHYMLCHTCSGIGEIKMWNPVLPRGFLKSK